MNEKGSELVLMMVGLRDLRGLFQHEQLHDWVVLEAPDSIPDQHSPAPGAVVSGEAGLASQQPVL